jgi:hypothetical protein
MEFHQAPFARKESRDGHEGGWSSSFDGLARYLGTVQSKTVEGVGA